MKFAEGVPQLLTPEEVAEVLRLTPEHVRRLLRSGDLPGGKIGGVWRVEKERLSQWVEEQHSHKSKS